MSFALNLWKEKKVDSRSINAPIKVEKYKPGVIPLNNFNNEDESLEWNRLGFAKIKTEKPTPIISLNERIQKSSSISLYSSTLVNSPDFLFAEEDNEDTQLITAIHSLPNVKSPHINGNISESSSDKRARIKQSAIERLYGSKCSHTMVSFENILNSKSDNTAISQRPFSNLISPLDAITKSSTMVNTRTMKSNSFTSDSNTTSKLSFVNKNKRSIQENLFEKSISSLYEALEDKNKRLKDHHELDSYISYVQWMNEEKSKQEAAFRGILTSEEEKVCDTDIDGDELAKNEWELRELERIERDLSLTTQESEVALLPETTTENEKASRTQYRFLQKYYHKGAFFTDETDPIYSRDYDLPTETDTIDKSSLPEVLQVRDFGKRSRSKWKHLTAEDTTVFDGHGWYQKNDQLATSMASRMAGLDRKTK